MKRVGVDDRNPLIYIRKRANMGPRRSPAFTKNPVDSDGDDSLAEKTYHPLEESWLERRQF